MAAIHHRTTWLLKPLADATSIYKIHAWRTVGIAGLPPSPLSRSPELGSAIRVPWSHRQLSTNSLPYILQPSFWRSVFPKFLRKKPGDVSAKAKTKSKGWNPATYFIGIFLLIGSQAIHLLSVRGDFDKFATQTDVRLAKLRETVSRIQNGEDVDVEDVLGTGDKKAEREWQDVIRELEEEDALYRQRRRKSKAPTEASSDSAVPNDTTAKA